MIFISLLIFTIVNWSPNVLPIFTDYLTSSAPVDSRVILGLNFSAKFQERSPLKLSYGPFLGFELSNGRSML